MGQGPPDRARRAYELRAVAADRDAPLPPDLMAGLYRRYEAAKDRAGRIDFEDMLELTIGLIAADAAIAAEVRDRIPLVLRRRIPGHEPAPGSGCWSCGSAAATTWRVVGDEDQTIYTFTGATSEYLILFADRYPTARAVTLETTCGPFHARGPGARQPRPGRGTGARST